MLTVRELIEGLKQCDPNAVVMIGDPEYPARLMRTGDGPAEHSIERDRVLTARGEVVGNPRTPRPEDRPCVVLWPI